MRWSSAILLGAVTTVGAVAPADAWAAACCVGNTSTVPTRVGECEHWTTGLGLEAEHTTGQWDQNGALTQSALSEDALISTLGAGYRFDRDWQVGLTLPVRTNRRATTDALAWGGGPGDLQLLATWDPVEERPWTPGGEGSAVPIVTFGVRAPTGTAWDESDNALAEDVTGKPSPALLAGVQFERATHRWPWSVGLATESEVDDGAVHPAVSWGATAGRYLGTRWSVVSRLTQVASWSRSDSGSAVTLTSTGGLRLVRGAPLSWRGWVGSSASVPLPGMGISSARTVSVSAGAVLVR
jgi:hypothetical protein